MRVLICAALLVLAACGQGATEKTAPPAAPAQPAPPPDLHGAIIGIGDNPVWRLDADPAGTLTLSIENGRETYTGHYAEPHRSAEGGFSMDGGPVSVDLSLEPCTIGDITYPMRAIVQPHRQAAVEGCAYVRWDSKLISLMPQIDACIAASPATRRITYAGPNQGAVLVRMAGDGAQVDCRVANTTASIAPREAGLHVLGDDEAIFVRALPGPNPGEQPGGECFTAPEVKAADGTLLGWMDDPQGC